MRLRLCFACEEGAILSYNYNHLLVAVVNSALQRAGTTRCRNGNKNLYTFSQLYFSDYNTCENGINNLGSSVEWYISSPLVYFLEQLLRGFKQMDTVTLGSMRLPLQEVEIIADPEISASMEFSCMSPITVVTRPGLHRGKPRYGRIGDSDFVDALRRDLVQKYYVINDSLPSSDNLSVEFNKRYMDNKKRVSRLIDFNGQRILGFMVPFVVEGNPELIKIGYQVGFGNNNHYGFGMVKVWHRVTQEQNNVS